MKKFIAMGICLTLISIFVLIVCVVWGFTWIFHQQKLIDFIKAIFTDKS